MLAATKKTLTRAVAVEARTNVAVAVNTNWVEGRTFPVLSDISSLEVADIIVSQSYNALNWPDDYSSYSKS